jgi:hypothetical protein
MVSKKRKFTRFPLNMNVSLIADNRSFYVDKVLNFSIGGCLLCIHTDLQMGTPCSLTINLGSSESDPRIVVEGAVMRSQDGNLAVKFVGIDPDSLLHLKMLARFNAPDAEKVEEEIKEHPGIL